VTDSSAPLRQSVIKAAIQLFGSKGYNATSVEEIAAEAGIDEGALLREFADKQDCLLQAWDEIAADYTQVVLSVYNRHDTWLDGLRAAAYASVEYIEQNPLRVRVGAIEVFSAGPAAQARRDLFLQTQVDLVHAARHELDDPDSVPRAAAETAVGAIWDTVVTSAQRGELDTPRKLVPQLMYLAVLPYFGPEAAAQELTISF
jgi:AcrR family transcriptional regulator